MSYVRTIRAALPGMRERGAGAIVNVASTAGKRPSPSMPDYSVTKAAVLSLSRLVADVYAKDGIRCNAVTPGPTATDAWLGEGGLADQQARRGKSRDEVLATVGAGRPLGRLAEPEEIAAVIVVPLLRPRELRDGRRLERRRRNRPDHHLALRRSTAPSPADRRGNAMLGRESRLTAAFAEPRALREQEEQRALAARRPLLRDARAAPAGGRMPAAHAVPARPRPRSSTRRRSAG